MNKLRNILLVTTLLLTTFMVASPKLEDNGLLDTLTNRVTNGSSTVYDDVKSLYNNDGKAAVNYFVQLLEKGAVRVDTVLSKGWRMVSKGSAHVYEVLKTQQLVKSFHHLFYWIVGIILTIVIVKKFKAYRAAPDDTTTYVLIALCIIDVGLTIYNSYNFMEMWTGFINPEYGVFLDIIEYSRQVTQ